MKVTAEEHFSGWFEPSFLKELTKVAIYSRVPKDEEIKSSSSYVKYIPLVLNGSIHVFKSRPDKKDILLYTIERGEICTLSYSAAMEHSQSDIKMIAASDTEMFLVPFQQITQWMKQYSSWNAYIIRLFSSRYHALISAISKNKKENLDVKLKRFLLSQSRKNKSKKITASQEELANRIGTTKSVISKLLKKLEGNGFLKRQKSTILLYVD